MSEYKVGYGKPPLHSRFSAGVTGNAKGRPKRPSDAAAQVIVRILSEPIQYRERGRVRTATRVELSIRALINSAAKGDVKAAEIVLDMRARAERNGDASNLLIYVHDWIPDYPGQTAEQKTHEFAAQAAGTETGWWQTPPVASGG